MFWNDQVEPSVRAWLLARDTPGVRFLTLRDLLDVPSADPDFMIARQEAHETGRIATILDKMEPDGYWVKPGAGYNPKYKATVWSTILLSQLGASVEQDERIALACEYLLDHSLTRHGQFTTTGAPSANIDCLQGNLCAAMIDLGVDDPRLKKAFEWLARSVTGEGVAPATDRKAPVRYYAGNCAPEFACGANNKYPCAWGAVKVMLAFSKWSEAKRTPLIERAMRVGIDFLLSTDPARADYPCGYSEKPSGNWWKFGFPVFYVTDLLQNVEALVALGYGRDPRLTNALSIIRAKQDDEGCWSLDYDYTGKTWVDFGAKKQPNKWVTLRALRVLKAVM